jgi:DNA-directed RNA polymerase subunit RPC12/RpoP
MRVQPVDVIVCVECGGRAHLLYVPDPESPYVEGDYAAYRCEDCMDRFDLEVTAEDVADEPRGAPDF